MNSERRDKCSWDRSAVGSRMSEPSGYSFRAGAVECYRTTNRERCDGGHQNRGPTYELFASALRLCALVLLLVPRLTRLCGMEPTADTQPLVPISTFLHHNLFDGMVALPRLHFEKDKLVPAGW